VVGLVVDGVLAAILEWGFGGRREGMQWGI